jgi:hypothetical protein
MRQLHEVVEHARRAAAEQARADLRAQLATQPHDWLVDQLVDRILTDLGLATGPAPVEAHRVRPLRLDETALAELTARLSAVDRDRLAAEGHLVDVPGKGGPLITPAQRDAVATAPLCEAKDLVHALLFGDEADGVALPRVARELLTLTVPAAKLGVFSFLGEAATEIGARGTWRDPAGTAHDAGAANTLVQVEYGETAQESVGRGLVAALRVINDLEVNEQILYARMEDVEESTLR